MAVVQTNSTDLELSSSQYWSITDAAQTGLDITGDITMEAWINIEQLPSTGTNNFMIIAKFDNENVKGRAYQMFLNSNDKLSISFNSANATQTDVVSTSAIVVSGDVGNWVHVAVSIDVSAGGSGVTMYKDGSSVGTTIGADNATSIQNITADFAVGARIPDSGAALFFDGLIDDARVWNDIRTGTEINDNKDNCDLSVSEAGLVSWWLFNNDGTDANANSNDLTNNNSATFSTDVPYTCAVAFTPRVMIY